ncbi:MAG: sterol desaturase family protein [Chitinophagales bacterium]|nr:sterol desaturase family protein [Chitinophagales bacterium]MDW8418885.1 sterol desaturase family protein [Chitinophagales bacterium]
MHPVYMLLVIPFFFLTMFLEWGYSRIKKQKWYRLNDTVSNLLLGTGQQLFGIITKSMLMGVYIWIYERYAFFHLPKTWWVFLICLVLFDFLFYWAHRWGHELNIFWAAHSVHHQSEEFNLSVALRQSWFHSVLAFPIFLPIPSMGFDPVIFGLTAIVHTLSQYWIHTKAIGKLPAWFEFWFNTPSHHRVHHAINPQYIDKNHAGLLMIWDRMFGTFKEEESDTPIYYGTTTPLRSWNPVWANFQYFTDMWHKARCMLRHDRWKMIFARPGWLPGYLGGATSVTQADLKSRRLYNADTHVCLKVYAVFQFFIMLAGAMAYMAFFPSISFFYKVVFFGLILTTMLIIGALFENKKWVIYAEYARLILAALALNSFYYFWYINWFHVMVAASLVALLMFAAFYTCSIFVKRTFTVQ